jgi:hypothetical protein
MNEWIVDRQNSPLRIIIISPKHSLFALYSSFVLSYSRSQELRYIMTLYYLLILASSSREIDKDYSP